MKKSTSRPTVDGREVRAKRRSADLTQGELAELAECSPNYIRMIEHGYVPKFRSTAIPRILDVLRVGGAGES